MPETNPQKSQRVCIRRQNTESPDDTTIIDTKGHVQISQTVAFVTTKIQTADDGLIEYRSVPVYSATWEFPAKNTAEDSVMYPGKGDVIIDADGTEWQVQKAANVTHRNIRQCQAYAEMTGFLPFDAIKIVRACAGTSEDGTRMTTAWRRVQSNIPAKIASEDVATHRKTTAKKNASRLRAYTREHLQLQKNDLVELPDGRQCKIMRTRNSRPMLGWTELFLAVNKNLVETKS